MKPTLLLLAALLAGCATVAPVAKPAPIFPVAFNGERYVCLALDVRLAQVGDLALYHEGGRLTGGRLLAQRGPGVFRVEGAGLVLVSASNYVGKLVEASK